VVVSDHRFDQLDRFNSHKNLKIKIIQGSTSSNEKNRTSPKATAAMSLSNSAATTGIFLETLPKNEQAYDGMISDICKKANKSLKINFVLHSFASANTDTQKIGYHRIAAIPSPAQ
jgi:hypothetical protein